VDDSPCRAAGRVRRALEGGVRVAEVLHLGDPPLANGDELAVLALYLEIAHRARGQVHLRGDLIPEVEHVEDLAAVVVPRLGPVREPLREPVPAAVDAGIRKVEVVHLDLVVEQAIGTSGALQDLPEPQHGPDLCCAH
jgi:hypothetical protein